MFQLAQKSVSPQAFTSVIFLKNNKSDYLHMSFLVYWRWLTRYLGFPGSSASKESTCNAEELGSIPGSGRSPEEGIGYPLQYSWASLAAQMVKNPPAMRETIWSLGWEDPLEEGMASTPVFWPEESPWT